MSHPLFVHRKSSWGLTMINDPIVDEIHKIREELLAEYGGLDGYVRHLEELRHEFQDRIVRREPRKPATSRKAS